MKNSQVKSSKKPVAKARTIRMPVKTARREVTRTVKTGAQAARKSVVVAKGKPVKALKALTPVKAVLVAKPVKARTRAQQAAAQRAFDYQQRAEKAWKTRRANLRKQGLLDKKGRPSAELQAMRTDQANRSWATRRAAA